jgi:hypothetical protein
MTPIVAMFHCQWLLMRNILCVSESFSPSMITNNESATGRRHMETMHADFTVVYTMIVSDSFEEIQTLYFSHYSCTISTKTLFLCLQIPPHSLMTWSRTLVAVKFLCLLRNKSKKLSLALVITIKVQTHRTRFDNATRFFSFWKLIKQPMIANFERYVDQITQNVKPWAN